MITVDSPHKLQELLKGCSGTIGFVPTMGALHNGHRSLIQEAKNQCSNVVVSIFVNPTQFLEGEDLETYPRRKEADSKICELMGVDYLFYPNTDGMYEADEVRVIAPNVRGYILEGHSRPGHYDGVLSVVMKLLNIVKPTKAFFGKKDAQQLMLISLMLKHYFMDIEIVACDTVRENDGLALSSRNIYLSERERKEALKLSYALKSASKMVMQGEVETATISAKMLEILRPLEVEYVAVVDREFNALDAVEINNTIVLVSAYVGTTHLIDNIWI